MELIAYLNQYFFTREELLARCGIDTEQLDRWQREGVMPKASYRLRLQLSCESFFGTHDETATVDYYAKGYESWIGLLVSGTGEACAIFAGRYRARLSELAREGIAPGGAALDSDAHIDDEWRHFLDGTYGLCTVTGLPEEIAAKETATAVIRELIGGGPGRLDRAQRDRLRQAVDLLDRVSSPFAPHEVARSSRARYVDAVRAAYGF